MQLKSARIFLADASPTFIRLLLESIQPSLRIVVAGKATDCPEAMRGIEALRPDAVLLDMELCADAGEVCKLLKPAGRCPVVLTGAVNLSRQDARALGGYDFIVKPAVPTQEAMRHYTSELAVKLRAAVTASQLDIPLRDDARPKGGCSCPLRARHDACVVAIGASTGGTDAILTVLHALPSDIPGIVIVQHMPAGFTRMFAARLDNLCALRVREACDGDRVERGVALLAPGNFQMQLLRDDRGYFVRCMEGERVGGHKPSVNVLFHSVAKAAGPDAVGVLLTGMGADGASGLLAMRGAGASTIGQDKASSVVYGMPKAAFDLGAVERQEPLENIARAIVEALEARSCG